LVENIQKLVAQVVDAQLEVPVCDHPAVLLQFLDVRTAVLEDSDLVLETLVAHRLQVLHERVELILLCLLHKLELRVPQKRFLVLTGVTFYVLFVRLDHEDLQLVDYFEIAEHVNEFHVHVFVAHIGLVK